MNPPTQDMSILSLVFNAGPVVQGIMLLLLIVSFMSWYYIFLKWMTIRAEIRKATEFEASFWSGSSLNDLYQAALNDRHNAGALERIFESGLREFNKLRDQHTLEPKDILDGSRRAMRATYQRELDRIESHLAFLASTGSVSPYVGLFGTVWGIMASFQSIGERGSASLAVVAPGISEALVATAAGLAVAIPAVIFFNYFSNRVAEFESNVESFSTDFINLIERDILTRT